MTSGRGAVIKKGRRRRVEPVRTSNGGGKYDTRKKSSSSVCKINARDSRGHLSEHRAPPLPPSFNVGLRRGSARRGGSQGPQRGPWAKTKAGVYFARPKRPHCCTHNIEIGGRGGKGPPRRQTSCAPTEERSWGTRQTLGRLFCKHRTPCVFQT